MSPSHRHLSRERAAKLAACLAGCLLPLASLAQSSDAAPLVIAITASAPSFSTLNAAGKLEGFNVDLAYQICQHLKRPCKLEITRFPEIIPSVSAGKAALGIGNTLKTAEREQQVAFTRPYWRSTSSFIGLKRLGISDPLAGLGEHKICALKGSKQADFLVSQGSAVQFTALTSNQEAITYLQNEQCQLALLPTLQALPFLQSAAGSAHAFIGKPMTSHDLGGEVHMVVQREQKALLQQINQVLDELISNGTHERLMRQHFPFSIF